MKNIKNIYRTVCLSGLLALGTSSCTDWLTIYPQDRVVEENFWEDKNDLEGVRYGAYRQMARTVSKLAVWGDLRSDSYAVNSVEHSAQGNRDTYIEIVNGMPDSSMDVFDWGGVYTTINYCNKVLQHGEEVLEKDKQFTSGEWIQMHAEMTALRALNYFYLIRAFKDVPYTTKVINKDSEVESFPLTNQLVVLDSIILDCERVKGKARNRFSDKRDTKGMITNCAIYAMLADMYLWRASLHEGRHDKNTKDVIVIDGEEVSYSIADDYNKAIEYAEASLKSLAEQNAEEQKSSGLSSYSETVDYGLGSNYAMIKNNFEGAAQATVPQLEAQTAIFSSKNSRESIFELQYSLSDELSNTIVNSLYGFGNGTHMMVNKQAIAKLYDGNSITSDGDNGAMWDSRVWVGCQSKLTTSSDAATTQAQANCYCMKYHFIPGKSLNMEGSMNSREIRSFIYSSTTFNNWIIYRMTDVMLIKAEALACLASSANLKAVKAICNAIHRRSYCNYRNPSKIPATDAMQDQEYTKPGNVYGPAQSPKAINNVTVNLSEAIMCVMNERQIELIGEGKRWFDLVRLAERCSYRTADPVDPREPGVPNGQTGMSAIVTQFLGTGGNQGLTTTLINRFKNRYGLYSPIYYMEVKAANGAIEQNPVWNKSKYER